ncbi:two-component system, chemotaxis family, CheB/CheR fusion protein [Ectothiorhodospira magna]|uniref:Two-component system, chemotaxis family, CheB/CheR fusion protein n=1 Tax=Ectothiorhodospira magna TaxID=867345 RepID=A0A1H9FR51_9GAMM|nr:chemotaxis protein CheB [Ectothiorhodospira magna]SEQ40366.1 two-component system, chemotaxis family, CheB/CheR fusion protein [Ectothiorhodospira magna]
MERKDQSARTLVGIGASAGGIEALSRLVRTLSDQTGQAYVVAQHLSPDYQSMLTEILSRETRLPVISLTDDTRPQPDTLYITPAAFNVLFEDGCLRLRQASTRGIPKPSVDLLFRSLALELGDHAVGVILSGTGSDGADGITAIKQAGGRVFAQDEASAKYPGMPQAAVATGLVDAILTPEEIAAALAHTDRLLPTEQTPRPEDLGDPGELDRILRLVRNRTGVDISQYKEATMLRRLQRRLAHGGCETLSQYLEYLHDHPDEPEALVRELHILVTSFFRDEAAFKGLGQALNELVRKKPAGEPLRIWVPGCATGEEAYSIGILIHEALRSSAQDLKLQIYATDVDLDALAQARRGLYSAGALEVLDPGWLQRYFTRSREQFRVSQVLRDSIVFARHDLMKDPPFLHLDLVSCRNLLIYLKSPMQDRVFESFHYALRVGGLLFLGRSETPSGRSRLFTPVSKLARLYRREPGESRYIASGRSHSGITANAVGRGRAGAASRELQRILDAILEAYVPPGLVVDEQLDIRRIMGNAGEFLSHGAGQTSLNAQELLPRPLALDLRALVARAKRTGAAAMGHRVRLDDEDGDLKPIRLAVRPLLAQDDEDLFLVMFESVSGEQEITLDQDDILQVPQDADAVQALEHELIATREHLQTVVEELETTNEELQSANEELQSTNEELQSANEELETSNEELQATNEELFTVNQELQGKTEELATLNTTLRNVKDSLPYALLVVDCNLCISLINPRSTSLFGVTDGDLSRPLMAIEGLRCLPELIEHVQRVLDTGQPVQTQISLPSEHLMRVQPFTDKAGRHSGAVVTFWDNAEILVAHRALRESESRLRQILDKSPLWAYVKDRAGAYKMVSQRFLGGLGLTSEQVISHVDEECLPPEITRLFRQADHEAMCRDDVLEREHHLVLESGTVVLLAQHFALRDEKGLAYAACMKALDITQRKGDECRLALARDQAEQANRAKNEFLSHMSHELRTPLNAILGFSQILEHECADDPDLTEAVQEILRAGWHLLALINDILDLSMLESGRLNVQLHGVVVVDVLQECITTLRQAAQDKGVTVTLTEETATSTCRVWADPTRLRQVLINLISNAIKYNRPQGTVTLSASAQGGRVLIQVADDGLGMDEEQLANLFHPFVRLSRHVCNEDGIGIGLSLSRRLVEMMAGDIRVESTPEQGSLFTLDLPEDSQQTSDEALACTDKIHVSDPGMSGGIAAGQPRQLRILYVEDNPANLRLVRRLLADHTGVHLLEAETGTAGLELARTELPGLILLDLNLPDLHGFEVLGQLRADRRTAGIPVVAVSADAGELRVTEALERGFCTYVEKPFRTEVLDEVLATFGQRRGVSSD